MKKILVTLLLASMMACTLLGCGDVSGTGKDRGTSVSEEKDKDKDKDKDKKSKDKKNKDKKNKDKKPAVDDLCYDAPSESINICCENLAFVAMGLGVWDDDPDYVFEKEDFAKSFEKDDDESYIDQMLLLRGLDEFSGIDEIYEAENGVKYRVIADDDTFASYMKNVYGIDDFDFEAYEVADLGESGLYHHDGYMYFFDNVAADMHVHFEYSYSEDYAFTYVYSVSTEYEDGTPLDGTISITLAPLDCVGWCDELVKVSFEAE